MKEGLCFSAMKVPCDKTLLFYADSANLLPQVKHFFCKFTIDFSIGKYIYKQTINNS